MSYYNLELIDTLSVTLVRCVCGEGVRACVCVCVWVCVCVCVCVCVSSEEYGDRRLGRVTWIMDNGNS